MLQWAPLVISARGEDMQMITAAYWRGSAAEFKDVRKLVFSALMIATYVMLSSVFIPLDGTGTLRVMTRFLPQVLVGAVCGPLMGFITGFAADWLGFVLIPTGNFVPGLLLTAALRGFTYGLFLYGAPIAVSLKASADNVILRFALCQFAVNALWHVALNSLWFTHQTTGSFRLGEAFLTLASARAATNFVQWPFQVILMIALCKVLSPVLWRMGWMKKADSEISGGIGR